MTETALEDAATYGKVAADARSIDSVEGSNSVTAPDLTEYWFQVRSDAAFRWAAAGDPQGQSWPSTTKSIRHLSRLMRFGWVRKLRKFTRENVRAFRRSRARGAGSLRGRLLLPLVFVFYVSGLHRVKSARSNSESGD